MTLVHGCLEHFELIEESGREGARCAYVFARRMHPSVMETLAAMAGGYRDVLALELCPVSRQTLESALAWVYDQAAA